MQDMTVTTVFTIYGTEAQKNLLAGLPHVGHFPANAGATSGAKRAQAPAKPQGSTAGSYLAQCPE